MLLCALEAASVEFGRATMSGRLSTQGTVQKWRRALEAAGVEFIDSSEDKGPGVRLRAVKEGKRK